MPIYEFHCEDCGKNFESLVLIASAVNDLTCKHCNSSNIKKMISATSCQPAKGSPIPAGALSGCSSRSGFS
ncbi:MAG: zinc ribbon domain-containing protein [Proteobacteria bacterium]|nr:zinc ribbon domain-containing protein [Pseudomonadota bacterium]MBU1137895.1 zinc ribbon domain-containing protein [Pseudomonadota bacterium]MBU1231297.1 zinc ribbon domain-containing protein [Pseudomonadota bacterium]MBU1417797.1 zinc ribbon domain-containing protein [Pseudomonadota bacterium]MBU1453673.1 zinc ribbon domain-containing protein [Pseudomonadota bacterium]